MASEETTEGQKLSPTAEPEGGDKAGRQPAAGPTSSESRCPVCLEDFEDKAFIDACFHAFCFACIVQWAQVTNSCPMCKTTFETIIHDVKANDNYQKFVIKSKPTPSHQEVSLNEARRFRYRTTRLAGHPHRPRRRESRRPAADERRRAVYSAGLKALPLETGERRGRVRNISAAFFCENPASTHRLYPWLSREFRVLLGEESAEFMIQIVMSLIDKVDLESEDFARHLEPFLHTRTSHFMHEFISFARCPYDFIAYDNKVRYDWPENMLPPAPPRPQPRDSWDPEATENLRGPSSPGPSSGLTSMQQRILDELSTARWDDSPPLLTTDSPITVHDSDSESPAHSSSSTAAAGGTEHSVGGSGTTLGSDQLQSAASSHPLIRTEESLTQGNLPSMKTAENVVDSGPQVVVVTATSEGGSGFQSHEVEPPSVSNLLPSGSVTALVADTKPVSSIEVTSTTNDMASPTARASLPSNDTVAPGNPFVTIQPRAVRNTKSEAGSHVGASLEDYGSLSLFPEDSGDVDLDSVSVSTSQSKKGKSVHGKHGGTSKYKKSKYKKRKKGREQLNLDIDSEYEGSHRHRYHSSGSISYHRHHRHHRSPYSSSDEDYQGRRRRRRRRERSPRERQYLEQKTASPRRHHYGDHDYERDSYSTSASSFQRERQQHRSRLYSDSISTTPPRVRIPSVVTVVPPSNREYTGSHPRSSRLDLAPGSSCSSDHQEGSRGASLAVHSPREQGEKSCASKRHTKGHAHHKRVRDKAIRVVKRKGGRDSVDTQLSRELEALEGQIKENKEQLLNSLLRHERLELLQKSLHSDSSDPDVESTFNEQYFMSMTEPSTITASTPTEEIVKELDFLDQAIRSGKNQVLKVAKERSAAHDTDED